MYSHVTALMTLFNFRDSLSTLIKQIDRQPEEAISKGLAFYNQGDFTQASPFLTIAAASGDRASQYAMGEITRRKAGSVTEEAKTWYRLAAAHNHVYALMRLGDEESLKKARELAQANADKGDAEAMLELYELDKDLATLKKAANAGSAEAQYILAVKYDTDETLITDTELRRTTINLILKKAADAGFPKAMHWYANRPPISQNRAVRLEWLIKRAEKSDINGVLEYGYALGGVYADDAGVDTEYGSTRDLVKGYGLVWLVVDTTREFGRHTEARENLDIIGEEMTHEQIVEAKAFARNWAKDHPPMSEFRLTYSDIG